MLKKLSLFLFATLLLNSTVQAVVVTPPVGDVCSEMFNYKGEVYVCADHPVYGKELHRINGDRYSTIVVKDLDPGPGGSGPTAFFESNGWLYFFAETTPTGYALWRTDGTEAGTKLIRSIGDYPDRVVANIGDDFFIINKDSDRHASLGNLIRTDGTYEGTKVIEGLVRSRQVGASFTGVQVGSSFISLGGNLYFITSNSLYRVNSDDTVSTIYENLPADSPDYSAKITGELFNGKIVIEGVGGRSEQGKGEIWLSDGTTAGTGPFITRQNEEKLVGTRVINNRLVYVKNNLSSGPESRGQLLSTDGEETIELLSDRYGFGYVASAGNRLIYITSDGMRGDGYVFTAGTVNSTKRTLLFDPSFGVTYGGFAYAYNGQTITKTNVITGISQRITAAGPVVSSVSHADARGVLYTAPLTFKTHLWLLKANGTSTKLGFFPGRHDIHIEGGRVYFIDPFSEVYGFEGSGIGIWHTNATVASTYQLEYRYDNGEPEPEPSSNSALVPILDLLMDEEEPVPD